MTAPHNHLQFKRSAAGRCVTLATAFAVMLGATAPVLADHKVVAKVDDLPITELDLQLAEAEIGRELGQLPENTRRRVLVEYLIENILFAKAAEEAKLDSGPVFDDRLRYMRRRALRETYFESKIRAGVSEAAAETFFKDRVKGMKPQEEVKARHILVKTEEEARDLKEQIVRGAEFAQIALKHSTDPGTKPQGGMLGYFTRGQMVPAFEQAAFELKAGDISEPVQSRFGWHIIKVEDRRTKPIPKFDDVKEQIMNSLVHQQTQAEADRLRESAAVEYIDPKIKAEVAKQKTKVDSQQKQLQQRVLEMHKKKESEAGKKSETKGAKPEKAGSKEK